MCGSPLWRGSDGAERGYKIIEVPSRQGPLRKDPDGAEKVKKKRVLIINLIGRVFFQKYPDCPFRAADKILENNKNKFENLSQYYYEKVYSIIKEPSIDCKNCNNKSIATSSSIGTSTIFTAPYSGCYSWGDGLDLIDEYSHGCNQYSGAVGAYSNAWIGGATAEAMQSLDIYVGKQKTLNVDAKIIKSGGKAVFGFGAFSMALAIVSRNSFFEPTSIG